MGSRENTSLVWSLKKTPPSTNICLSKESKVFFQGTGYKLKWLEFFSVFFFKKKTNLHALFSWVQYLCVNFRFCVINRLSPFSYQSCMCVVPDRCCFCIYLYLYLLLFLQLFQREEKSMNDQNQVMNSIYHIPVVYNYCIYCSACRHVIMLIISASIHFSRTSVFIFVLYVSFSFDIQARFLGCILKYMQ